MGLVGPIRTENEHPILFRTGDQNVYRAAIEEGSLWLRSAEYFRRLEDEARRDKGEGVSAGSTCLELWVQPENRPAARIYGEGSIGQVIDPHYILSMHGHSIREEIRQQFGGWTFGIVSLWRLAIELVYQASLQLPVTGYRFGQVAYQYTSLTVSARAKGGPINFGGTPELRLTAHTTDVLRKIPIEPFIHQDEWRIAVFVPGYLDNDPDAPLKLRLNRNLFFPYAELREP